MLKASLVMFAIIMSLLLQLTESQWVQLKNETGNIEGQKSQILITISLNSPFESYCSFRLSYQGPTCDLSGIDNIELRNGSVIETKEVQGRNIFLTNFKERGKYMLKVEANSQYQSLNGECLSKISSFITQQKQVPRSDSQKIQRKKYQLSATDLLMAIFFGGVIPTICILLYFKYYVCIEETQPQRMKEKRKFELSDTSEDVNKEKEDLQKMKKTMCSICLRQKCNVRLQCSHGFHGECIIDWLNMHPLCPVCRHTVKCSSQIIKFKIRRSFLF